MNKKLLSILCIIFAIGVFLCACGGAGDTNTETETNSETNTETNTETDTATDSSEDTETDTNTDTSANEIEYTVTVVDYNGNPVSSGLFVQMYQNGEEIGSMKKASKDGTATFSLEKGEYTFELIYTDNTLTYDLTDCTLTAKKPSKEVMLYNVPNDSTTTIFPYDSSTGDRYEYEAGIIREGANKVGIDKMSYYVFRPTRGGVYKFSYICDVKITIGYYGGSGYVLPEKDTTVENEDGSFELEILDSSISTGSGGTASYVIGVRSLATDNCFLTIERIGEATKDIQRLEYVPKEVPSSTSKYNYLNCDLVDIDITDASLEVVYNEDDGYYHLGTEDGAIVLIRITTAGKYIASFKDMCDATKLFKIFTDEEGNPLREEIYNEMLLQYADKCDAAGVVPLTQELEYVVKNVMEQQGWYYGDSNIFKEPDTVDESGNVIDGAIIEGITEENAWLFACCTLVENDKGAEDSKIVVADKIDPISYLVKIDGAETLYFKSSQSRTAVLTIKNAQGVKVTVYGDDNEYVADENGKIEIILSEILFVDIDEETGDVTEGALPIEFAITNTSEEKLDIEFTYVTYVGE